MQVIHSINSFENYLDQAKYLIARNVTLSSGFVFGLICFFLADGDRNQIFYYYIISAIISSLSFLFLLFCKKFHLVFYGMAIGGTAIVQLAANFGDHSLHYAGFSWLILSILFSFIGTNKYFSISLVLLNSLGVLYFAETHFQQNLDQLNREIINYDIITGIEIISILLMVSYIIFTYIRFSELAQQSLEKANLVLEENNDLIQAQNEEKTVLVKEIHHRIKNNLQIIISLLRMQRMEVATEEAKENFTEAINRIMTMSLIHQKLYSEEELSKIDLKSYIEELVGDLISVSLWREKVKLKVESNIDRIGLDMVVPLGLLINELVSNSLKYAFDESESGIIEIKLKQKEEFYDFSYFDNGVWKEPELVNSGFGSELIDILTEQLNGTKTLNTEKGTRYNFILREPE